MTVPFSLPGLRLRVALFPLLLWACSSGGAAGPDSGDAQPPADGSNVGSASAGGSGPSGDDSGDAPGKGSGSKGSVAVDEPEQVPSTSGKSGKSDEPAPEQGEGGASNGEVEPTPPSEGFLRGQALVTESECVTCHQENFAGFTAFPNITPDLATGIGAWTDAQIISAVRDGLDPEGAALCDTMMRYPLSDAQAADLVEFLRGIPGVSNKLTSDCR